MVKKIFDKGAKTLQCGKGQSFQQIVLGKLDRYPHAQTKDKKHWTLTLYHIQKKHSKKIKDLNIRAKAVELLEGNIGKSFMTLDLAMIS